MGWEWTPTRRQTIRQSEGDQSNSTSGELVGSSGGKCVGRTGYVGCPVCVQAWSSPPLPSLMGGGCALLEVLPLPLLRLKGHFLAQWEQSPPPPDGGHTLTRLPRHPTSWPPSWGQTASAGAAQGGVCFWWARPFVSLSCPDSLGSLLCRAHTVPSRALTDRGAGFPSCTSQRSGIVDVKCSRSGLGRDPRRPRNKPPTRTKRHLGTRGPRE